MKIKFGHWQFEPELKSYVVFGNWKQGASVDGVEVVVTPTVYGTMEIDVVHGTDILFRSHETLRLPEAKRFAKAAALKALAA
ncbi:MAG: hypothetical protein ABJL55_17100 [Roseibium sp.]